MAAEFPSYCVVKLRPAPVVSQGAERLPFYREFLFGEYRRNNRRIQTCAKEDVERCRHGFRRKTDQDGGGAQTAVCPCAVRRPAEIGNRIHAQGNSRTYARTASASRYKEAYQGTSFK